jgi:hypothetical protein
MYPQVFQPKAQITELPFTEPGSVKVNQRWTPETKIFLTLFLVAVAGGAIRKWVTTSSVIGNIVLLVQMVMPFLLFYFRSATSKSPFVHFKSFGFYVAFLLFQVINPMQHTLFHGMLGIIIYGGFWLGLFFYLTNRDKFQMDALMKWFLIAAGVEIVLGFVQYALPPDNILNKYAQERQDNIAVVADSVRITGTFSYISGFTAYTIFHAFLVWALIRLRYPNWVTIGVAALGLVACFMTGSRGGTLVYLALLAPVFLKEFSGPQLAKLFGSLVIPAVIVILVLIGSGNKVVIDRAQKASDNFWERVTSLQKSGEQNRRLSFGLELFNVRDKFESPLIGIGTGATYQGATLLFGKSVYAIRFGYVESEFIQIVLEGGLVMLLFRIILATTLVLNLSFKGPIRLVIWGCIIYVVPVVFNVHNAAFMMMGIVLIDNIIWRQKVFGVQAVRFISKKEEEDGNRETTGGK